MSIKKIKFITPLINGRNYKLVQNYSHTIILNNNEKINVASKTGARPNQEDSIAVQVRHGYIMLLIADGMGGKSNGQEASYVTAQQLRRWFAALSKQKLKQLDENNLKMQLIREINEMKDSVFPLYGGTTLNMSIIGPEKTFIINIGDSRAYSIKNNKITIRTMDDSVAFQTFNPSTKKERDAIRYYAFNNIITNCIEMKSIAKINIYTLNNSDYDILCHMTDGVSDILTEDKIKKYILSKNPAEALVEKSVNSKPEYRKPERSDFVDFIEPHDNASAIVYTKKRTKNN